MSRSKPRYQKSPFSAKDEFRRALGEWFQRVGKDYPWRRTREPYPILVSEIMLQQTQITTVLGKGYYSRFLEKFPDLVSLAKADDGSLLKAWEGLGYYRRARMLRDTARKVLEKHAGVFPSEEAALLDLPGVGPYTAAALQAFAFGQPSGLVDGNVSRVLARLMEDSSPIDSHAGFKKHREWALELCDPIGPGQHHHAMMELGQTLCRPGNPSCEICPISQFCQCTEPEKLPVKKPPVAITQLAEYAIFQRDFEGRILLHLESGKRRQGLWKLPLRSEDECSELTQIYDSVYAITRYRVLLRIFLVGQKAPLPLKEGDEWIDPERLDELAIAAPFRRALQSLIDDF